MPAPRKVVHIITRLDRGGSARNTMLTVMELDRAQFDPVVITGSAESCDAQGGPAATEENLRGLEKESIRYHVLPSLVRPIHPWKDLLALWRLSRLLRQERPAIVHTHTSKAGVLGRLAARAAAVPTVVHTPHGHVFYGHFGRLWSWVFLQLERALSRVTDWLIGLTEAERRDHLERGVGSPERFAVIPSGIDLERFRRAREPRVGPELLGCPPGSIVVGSIGWLTNVKGHRVLVDAAAAVKRACPALHVVLIGSGDQREALERQARELGISDAVHLLGHREDVERCLAGFDCFVLPSFNEGMGRALVEAMASGLPVIASRVGGIPALIDDGINGLLVPAGDSGALAHAISLVIRDPERAVQLGRRAKAGIGSTFGIQAMVHAVEAVYREAAGIRA